MNEHEKYKPPKTSLGDHAHTVARAGIGAIPAIGGSAAELFNTVIVPPLEKRRAKWMEEIAQGLRDLERQESLKLEDLSTNEAFVTTVMHASQAALRNSQQEKIQALRNAALNAALPHAPDESIQLLFIRFVDEFTVWHLRILDLFENPAAWFEKMGRDLPDFSPMGGSRASVLVAAYPELRSQRALYDLVVQDLFSRRLFAAEGLQGMVTGGGMMQGLTTELGRRFLAFIRDPRHDV